MKKRFRALAVCFTLVLTLCACTGEQKLRGTWQGDGDLDILGMTAPFEFAEEMVFEDDGDAIIVVNGAEKYFTWSATSDTITFYDGEVGYGITFKVKGKTLRIDTGGDTEALFTKID